MSDAWSSDPYVVAFPEIREFWQAAERGEFLLPRCADCGEVHWFPRAACPSCRSGSLRWERARGRATLHTFTVLDRPSGRTLLAYVQLEEGPLMLTNVVDADVASLRIGMPLQVAFRRTPEGRNAPVFVVTP
jgi:uncharacterized OB-fold protein